MSVKLEKYSKIILIVIFNVLPVVDLMLTISLMINIFGKDDINKQVLFIYISIRIIVFLFSRTRNRLVTDMQNERLGKGG